MNEEHKKRGIMHSKFFTAVAISALLLGSSNVMATQTAESSIYGVAEQLQTITVTGVVLDATGEPIIGASVVEKGTTNGGITDINGKFTLSVKQGAVLKISYVGYQTQEVKAVRTMKIILKEDSEILSEVVVVGYGSQKRANLTGAIATVDVSKTLEGRQIADIGRGLQGTTPGLSVVIPSGEIGSDPTIKVRGQIGSIDGSSTPLILLDNVEIPSIQMVNPDDVESITVLKDAASASIYGAKAAFGVVLITSKKGARNEKVEVSYSGNFSWQNISKKMEMAGVDGIQYRIDALKRAKGTLYGAFWYVDETSLERAKEWENTWGGKLGVNDPFVYGRDWYVDASNRKFSIRTFDPYDYMIREWTPSQTHNISLSGKSGKTTFNVGLGYLDQNGLMKVAKHDDFRRWNGSIRLSTEINKYITARAGANYSKRNKRYAYATNSTTADPWLYLYRWDSTYPMGYDENGNEMRSPVSEVHQANTANKEDNYLSFNVGATLKITKDWKFDIDYTYAGEDQIWKKNGTKYTAADTWTAPVKRLDGNGNQIYVNNKGEVVSAGSQGAMPAYDLNYRQYTADGGNPDHIRRQVTNAKRHTLNITTDYNWQINKQNNLKVLAGMNRTDWESEDNWSQITNLTDINNLSWDKTIGTQTSSGNLYWDGQLGFFGRVNYNFMDKYLLEANVRYDGSSKFGQNNKYAFFPSVGLGWMISNEDFLKDNSLISKLKLHTSYGVTGNSEIGTYKSLATVSQSNTIIGDALHVVSYLDNMPNPDLKWEKTGQWDLGFELGLFNNRLNFDISYYYKYTSDLLLDRPVPESTGYSSIMDNIGAVSNRGVDILVTAYPIQTHDFQWTSTLNLGFNKNRVEKLDESASVDPVTGKRQITTDGFVGYDMLIREGEELSSFYGYKRAGIYDGIPSNWDPETMNIPFTIGEKVTYKKREIIGNGLPDWMG